MRVELADFCRLAGSQDSLREPFAKHCAFSNSRWPNKNVGVRKGAFVLRPIRTEEVLGQLDLSGEVDRCGAVQRSHAIGNLFGIQWKNAGLNKESIDPPPATFCATARFKN